MIRASSYEFSPYRLILREMLLYFTMVIIPFRCHSVVSNSATLWTVAHQVPLSMGFSRQEYWSGLPFPSPGGLPNPGIKLRPPALQADSLLSEQPGKPKEHLKYTGILQLLGNSYILFTLQSSSLGNIQMPRFLFLREPLHD